MAVAVLFTMPLVGMDRLGARNRSSAAESDARRDAAPGFVTSTTKSRVAMRLVTESTGLAPSGHSAETMPVDSSGWLTSATDPPSARNALSSVFWYGVSMASGAGTHTRVRP